MGTEAHLRFRKEPLLATLCENELASICIYGTQLFAHRIPQLFIDCMIGILGQMLSLNFDFPLHTEAEKVAVRITCWPVHLLWNNSSLQAFL